MSVRVAVIDGQPVARVGLRTAFERDGRVVVVGEAGDAHGGYQLIAHTPEVALVDIRLPGEDGIAACRELRRMAPQLRILCLGWLPDPSVAAEALDAGALGVMLKSQPLDAVIDAVLTVAAGSKYLAPDLSAERVEEERKRRRLGGTPVSCLSRRERVIFDLFVRGFGNGDVARELFISTKTVETHRAHIFAKLRVHSMAELVRFAASWALLPMAS
jgi:two-component system response regulator NreC